MDRGRLYNDWRVFYGNQEEAGRLSLIQGRADRIVSQMVRLARSPGRMYKDMVKRRLETALGMSLGVHRQLLWGLTSDSRGAKMIRAEGGMRFK